MGAALKPLKLMHLELSTLSPPGPYPPLPLPHTRCFSLILLYDPPASPPSPPQCAPAHPGLLRGRSALLC